MKKLILEEDIEKLKRSGSKILYIEKSCIITPLAYDKIREYNIEIKQIAFSPVSVDNVSVPTDIKKISIGSDHTGFKVKNLIKDFLINKNYEVFDVGCFDENSCDYPDFAYAAAMKVRSKDSDVAIMFDATGIPSAIVANKIYGIRAAVCYNEFSAKSSRAHNNANFLSLGAKTLGEETIKSIIETFLTTKFEGGRHQRRLDKISQIEIEGKNLKNERL